MPRKFLLRLLSHDATGGILLLLSTLIAIYLANSSLSNAYHHFLQENIIIGFGTHVMSRSLEFWVNDFLMVIFYYLIGSEIKREVMQGELSSLRHASLPVFAALGGMIFPALIFSAFNFGGDYLSGWGIPMATDIAFSLGILSLLGKRVPVSMKVFLVSLAVVDDLGAVIVIAVFYTAEIATNHLFISLGIFALMVLINYRKIYVIWVYLILGLFLWYHFLQSGVHPTIAGVLLAIVVPAKRQLRSTRSFTHQVKELSARLKILRKAHHGKMLLSDEERKMVDGIISASKKYSSPLQNAERILQPWVIAFIMPLFAFTNAGIMLDGTTTTDIMGVLQNPVALGIMLGLLFGKQTGIMLFTWMAFKFGWGQLSPDMTWKHLYGISLLAGIGFTMSIFISGLTYSDPDILNTAKVGIIIGSLLSGIAGTIVIRRVIN